MLKRHRRELAVAIAIATLALVLAVVTPEYFSAENLSDLFLANMPVLIAALGATLVILCGQIDISVGSIFGIAAVVSGIAAKADLGTGAAAAAACAAGAALGALNGALVAFVRIPSIIVTLATMVALRDGLRWATEGAWVENLPASFQWLGLSQRLFPAAMAASVFVLLVATTFVLYRTRGGRAIYATGSNAEAARLAGFDTAAIAFFVFVAAGALTGVAAMLNAARFNQIPGNAGLGLEMKVIASVVVGGTTVTGGRGTVAGTLLGVVLLGAIGPALTFLGVSAYWERAIQGAIILAALVPDAVRIRAGRKAPAVAVTHV